MAAAKPKASATASTGTSVRHAAKKAGLRLADGRARSHQIKAGRRPAFLDTCKPYLYMDWRKTYAQLMKEWGVSQTQLIKARQFYLKLSIEKPLDETALVDWLEHSNPSIYRRDILRKMHSARLVEYNNQTGQVTISPTGIHHVETELSEEL